MASVPSLPPLPISACRPTYMFSTSYLLDAYDYAQLISSKMSKSKLCIKQNQQSSFEQGFNIRAGSIQREYYLFLEISNFFMLLSREKVINK